MAHKALVILGSQWGDEGKGKIVDLLAENADLVCRTGGGSNAGTSGPLETIEEALMSCLCRKLGAP